MLKTNRHNARKVISALQKQGYIEACQFPGSKSWMNTILGNKLSLASAAKPFTRDTANKQLEQFLDRVIEVRDADKYLYKVTHVCIFGSFLSKKEKLNDVDIWINLEPKDSKKVAMLNKRRYIKAISEGKRTAGALRAVDEPRAKVIKYLKNSSRVISLHIADPIIESCKHKVVYLDRAGSLYGATRNLTHF